jgi:23S rRNA pseudouridine1911/1915/1917 synthase
MALNHGFAYRVQVGAADAGRTLAAWLAATYAHSSPETWAARLAGADVTVDGDVATGAEVLAAGQIVVWQRPPWDEPDVPRTFDVVHEDADLVAVAKPGGLPTMPAGGFLEHTLLALVRARFGDAHPAHRLGRGTSGLVLFARTREAAAALGCDWRGGTVTKVYRALATGDPPWTSREIAVPIGPVPHATLGTLHAASPAGRAAHSVVTVRERRGGAALCNVQITTGRPHQIRIHLAAAGHPLVGDPLYTDGGLPLAGTHVLPGDGGYLLHAHTLDLPHPRTRRPLRLVAPPPPALRARDDAAG